MRRLAGWAAAALLLSGCGGGGHGSSSAGTTPANGQVARGPTISGASTAQCSPSPCAPGSSTAYTLTGVPDGAGNSSTRVYRVYRPANLTASAGNRAAAVLVFYWSGVCGYSPTGMWHSLSIPHRFIVVDLEVPCGRSWATNNWSKRWVTSDPGPATPDDEPYVHAVVKAIERCPGQCADPRRIYAVGVSSGANMVADVMCDPANSPLFRGFDLDSSSLELFNGAPDCPSTNRSYFAMLSLSNYGLDSWLYYDRAPHPHLDINQSGTHFQDWMARRLGCTGGERVDRVGTATTANSGPHAPAMSYRYRYFAPCLFATSGAAVEAIAVLNGGHGWPCQDSAPSTFACPRLPDPPGLSPAGAPWTDGLYLEQEFVKLISNGVS